MSTSPVAVAEPGVHSTPLIKKMTTLELLELAEEAMIRRKSDLLEEVVTRFKELVPPPSRVSQINFGVDLMNLVAIHDLPLEMKDGLLQKLKWNMEVDESLLDKGIKKGTHQKELVDEAIRAAVTEQWDLFDSIVIKLKKLGITVRQFNSLGFDIMKSRITVHEYDHGSVVRNKLLSVGISKEAIDNGSMVGRAARDSIKSHAQN